MRHNNRPHQQSCRPFRVDPVYRSEAPSKRFEQLAPALEWAQRTANRYGVPMTVVQVADNGRSVARVHVDPH